jgi:FKBP-type peptidyl-prolyl cis-trans isomerase FkpA
MKKLICLLLLAATFTACKKDQGEAYDAEKQLAIDEQLIKDHLETNGISAERDEDTGVYYIISEPGSGELTYYTTTQITVRYTGKLLNGSVFDSNTSASGRVFTIGGLIPAWQIAVPKIQKGGKIRFFTPSYWGYGPYPSGSIPANSVLEFEIELLDVVNP